MVSWAPQHPRVLERLSEGQSMAVRPVAEVTVLPKPGDSAAKGNLMSAARVEADAGALVWPQMCCCCGSTTDLDSIRIYSMTNIGNMRARIHILYCRRCKSHHRGARQRASDASVTVLVIGFTILAVSFLFGMLNEFVGFFLQLLVIFGSVIWGTTRLLRHAPKYGMESHLRVRAVRPLR